MSNHANDRNPIITRDNYEEYFVMYVDDELTPQERSMVDAFLQFHPELQAEMDLLMGAKLQPDEALYLGDKETLMAEHMSRQLVDESLLLHVDGELTEAEAAKVGQRLEQDEHYRNQYQLLMRTKSDPAEVIPYPNKEELYRHTVYRMRFGAALRVAAAVLLLASLGLVWWMQNDSKTDAPSVAVTTPKQSQSRPQAVPPATQAAEQATQQPETVLPDGGTDHQGEAVATQLAKAPATGKKVQEMVEARPERNLVKLIPVEDQQIAYEPTPLPERNEAVDASPAIAAANKNVQQDVTSVTAQPYNPENAVEPEFASTRSNKDNNLKSLLRKATRIVERRAHINATNEDDELIIGAVAIRLK